MKLLIFILNVYILTLSLLPCEDRAEYKAVDGTEQIELSSASNKDGATDECAPFCTCTCCSVFKTIPAAILVEGQMKLVAARKFSMLPVSTPMEISLSIWQPPKLG